MKSSLEIAQEHHPAAIEAIGERPVRDIRAYTGAGWLVPLCGEITQMPGLGGEPAAVDVDIDKTGRTVGLL